MKNPASYLNSAAPSHYEGFFNTFLESFAAGTPVSAAYRVDPDSIITKHQLGFTREDDEALADGAVSLVNKGDAECSTLAKKCQQFLINNFHPKVKAQELVRVLPSRGKNGT
jgi:glycosyltransferase involved in cell wall biosynthesis